MLGLIIGYLLILVAAFVIGAIYESIRHGGSEK